MANISKTLSIKVYAYVFTQFFWTHLPIIRKYRNHKTPISCTMAIYSAVYDAMKQRLDSKLQDFIDEMTYQATHGYQIQNIETNLAFRNYINEYKENPCDAPISIRQPFKGDIAAFLLSGEFLLACTHDKPFDALTLAWITRDIYSRFYTLMKRNIIALPTMPMPKKEVHVVSLETLLQDYVDHHYPNHKVCIINDKTKRTYPWDILNKLGYSKPRTSGFAYILLQADSGMVKRIRNDCGKDTVMFTQNI